jgi:hypothetical protein
MLTLAATNSDGGSLVILGVCLLAASPVLYLVLPRFDKSLGRSWFKGKERKGRWFRVVGGPILVATFGVVALASGLAKL